MIHRYLKFTANGRVNYRKANQQAWVRFKIKAHNHAKSYDEAYHKHLKWLNNPTLFGSDS